MPKIEKILPFVSSNVIIKECFFINCIIYIPANSGFNVIIKNITISKFICFEIRHLAI